jgi:SEC-C motif
MTERRFPTDAEVDAWIADHMARADDPRVAGDPAFDQATAATKVLSSRLRGGSLDLLAQGALDWAVHGADTGDDHSRYVVRSFARMYLAAASAGIRPLCPHVNQRRPLVLFCDPPSVTCADCGPAASDRAKELGWQFQGFCDRCGAASELMTPMMGPLGHIMVSGHVCGGCADEDRRQASQAADQVRVVGRNQPCPCGSGRTYKHCHGKPKRPTPDQPLRFLRQVTDPNLGLLDAFAAGPEPGGTVLLVPAIDVSWPAEIKNAVERRRRATLYGRCDCGEQVRPTTPTTGGVAAEPFPHEPGCPATDEALAELFARYGINPLGST